MTRRDEKPGIRVRNRGRTAITVESVRVLGEDASEEDLYRHDEPLKWGELDLHGPLLPYRLDR
jgi:hypothetical protein